MRGFWRSLTSEDQLRWLGPEKGVIHLATGAIVNAVWDLWAKSEGKPLFRLLADLEPAADRRRDRLPLHRRCPARARRRSSCCSAMRAGPRRSGSPRLERVGGYPAYTTSAGWLGYDDEKIVTLAREAVAAGFTHVKMKVGQDVDVGCPARRADPRGDRTERHADDGRQPVLGRRRGDRRDARARRSSTRGGSRSRPVPMTSSGTRAIRREIAPIRVATGEHVQNRVIFKQLFQARGDRRLPDRRLPRRRRQRGARRHPAGREVRRSRSARTPAAWACASTSSTSRCSTTSRSAARSRTAWSNGSTTCTSTSAIRPVVVDGRYLAPTAPGYSIEMLPASLDRFEFPQGRAWTTPD